MNNSIYELSMELSTRVGRLLGTIGAVIKYDNPELSNTDFKILARTYIETVNCQSDIDAVMEQANKRGVDLT